MSSFLRRLVARLLIGSSIWLGFSPRAFAQVDVTRSEAAAREYDRAQDLIEKQRWTDARAALLPLWNQAKTHDVAASLGQVEFHLGNFVEAANYLSFAIANFPPGEKSEVGRRYRLGLEEIRTYVGTLSISVNRSGAQIWVDGKAIGTSPLPGEVYVTAGSHVVEAKLGEASTRQSVTVGAKEARRVEIDLIADVGSPGIADVRPPHSTHIQAPPALGSEHQRGLHPSTVLIVGGAITGVALGSAVFFKLRARSANSDAERSRENVEQRFGRGACASGSASEEVCSGIASSLDDRNSSGRLSNVSFAIAGVAAVATGVTFLIVSSQRKPERHALAVSFSGQPRSGGVLLQGSF